MCVPFFSTGFRFTFLLSAARSQRGGRGVSCGASLVLHERRQWRNRYVVCGACRRPMDFVAETTRSPREAPNLVVLSFSDVFDCDVLCVRFTSFCNCSCPFDVVVAVVVVTAPYTPVHNMQTRAQYHCPASIWLRWHLWPRSGIAHRSPLCLFLSALRADSCRGIHSTYIQSNHGVRCSAKASMCCVVCVVVLVWHGKTFLHSIWFESHR